MKSMTLRPTPTENSLFATKLLKGTRFPFPYHNHDSYELTFVARGKGMRIINDNVDEFDSGDIVLLAPYLAHQWQSDSYKIRNVLAYCVYFSEYFPSKDFQQLPAYKNIRNLKKLAKRGIQLKGKLRNDITRKITSMYKMEYFGQIIQLLSILNEISLSDEYDLLSKSEAITKETILNDRINRIMDYIVDHYKSKLSIQSIADVACMHKASVGRFFKHITGFTLVEYINLVRIGKVCEQLNETSKSINVIAMECGFDNLSNFNRCFKKLKGITPQQYRNSTL